MKRPLRVVAFKVTESEWAKLLELEREADGNRSAAMRAALNAAHAVMRRRNRKQAA